MPPDQPSENPTAQPSYDFIINPQKPPRKPVLGGTSLPIRIAVVVGGLFLLIIIFSILKGLLATKPKFSSMVTVLQDQQEIIHLNSNANQQQQKLSPGNQDLAATAQISVTSAQAQLLAYLTTNHYKVSTKVVNQRVSTNIDTELTNALTAGTYDQTFQDVMKTQLNTYITDMQQAYNQITGHKGRALLISDYDQAKLLLSQTNTPIEPNTD